MKKCGVGVWSFLYNTRMSDDIKSSNKGRIWNYKMCSLTFIGHAIGDIHVGYKSWNANFDAPYRRFNACKY